MGNFFGENQNTVFFICEGIILQKVWKKQDYGYNPHITIYDGNDKTFAHGLHKLLSQYQVDLVFKVEELKLITKSNGQKSFELKLDLNNELFKNTLEQSSIYSSNIERLSNQEKFNLINKIMQIFVNLSSPSQKSIF